MLKMPIFHASVHTHDAEYDIFMNVILKYNTYIVKPQRHHIETFYFIFQKILTFLYGPVLGHQYPILALLASSATCYHQESSLPVSSDGVRSAACEKKSP